MAPALVVLGAAACAGSSGSGPAAADTAGTQPGDESATRRIDEAVNELYLADKPDEAEGELVGIIEACDQGCSPPVRARGWMYVGIVRGSGSGDQEGARDAFERAVREDPRVRIDEALATPTTIETFRSVSGE